jgi:lipopolysaccharide/colanic/teichoic acid biosynthesis glycosyltransferase
MARKLDSFNETQPLPYPLLKWVTDKAISSVLLLLFSPVLIIIVLGMALNMLLSAADRGPFLYHEPRISQGKQFSLLKFRVLRKDVLAQMPADDKHARLLEEDQSNLTWAGRWLLKKWYFDELPQIFNILKGDMSLVGPRPWPISLAKAQVERGLIYRNLILAGWTGPSQLQKGNPQPQDPEKLDLDYLHRCRSWPALRFWMHDLGLLFQTIGVIVRGKGLAY